MANFYPSIDTSANWISVNRVPLLDEWCLESDTRMVKVGDGSTHYNDLQFAFIPTILPQNIQSGTSYTVASTDMGKVIVCTNAAAVSLTIPTNASVPCAVGSFFQVLVHGTGQATVSGASGVTIESASSPVTRTRYSIITFWQYAVDEWICSGDMQ